MIKLVNLGISDHVLMTNKDRFIDFLKSYGYEAVDRKDFIAYTFNHSLSKSVKTKFTGFIHGISFEEETDLGQTSTSSLLCFERIPLKQYLLFYSYYLNSASWVIIIYFELKDQATTKKPHNYATRRFQLKPFSIDKVLLRNLRKLAKEVLTIHVIAGGEA